MKITCILVNCMWLLHEMRDDAALFVLMRNLCTQLGLDQ